MMEDMHKAWQAQTDGSHEVRLQRVLYLTADELRLTSPEEKLSLYTRILGPVSRLLNQVMASVLPGYPEGRVQIDIEFRLKPKPLTPREHVLRNLEDDGHCRCLDLPESLN